MKFVQVFMVFVKHVEIDFASDGSKIVMYIVYLGMLIEMGEKLKVNVNWVDGVVVDTMREADY
jgi:hypothetical protein